MKTLFRSGCTLGIGLALAFSPARAQNISTPAGTTTANTSSAAVAAAALTPANPAPASTTSAPAPLQRDTLGVSDVKILPALFTTAERTNTLAALQRLAQSLDGQLIAALGSSRKFQILARSDLDVILKEQSLGSSGTVDDSSAAKMFRLAGAKYLLTLSIDDFQDRLETASFPGIGEQAQRRKVTLSCVTKIYAAQSGKLLETVNLQVSDQDVRNNPAYIQDTGGQWAERLPVNLARLAADKISQRVTDLLYPAKVIAKTGSQITLNRGEGTGIVPGQVWTIYATGKALVDPDTGENLGFEEVAIGKAKVTDVTARTASAEVTEDRGVTTLSIARPAQ